MRKLKVRCAAKVNLCLEIINRRPDGYHNLRSLMTAVGVWDEILIEPSERFVLTDLDGITLDEHNTVCRAATLFAEATKKDLTFAVRLKKVIPVQAGLGGGSSDGAATVLAFRKLCGLRWSWKKLIPLAAKIGADVPFFLVPTGAAIVEGIGEILTPVRLPTLWLVLVKPDASMSTQEAFSLWDAHPFYVKTDPAALVTALWQKDVTTVRRLTVNAFEEIIAAKVSAVTELKQRLMTAGAVTALMSGSGTTVFGVFFDRESATRAVKFIEPVANWYWLARTVRQSVIFSEW